MSERRRMRPRDRSLMAAVAVSQLTIEAVVGIDPRRYLELLAAHPELPRTSVGRLRIVPLDGLQDLLAHLAVSAAPAGEDGGEDDGEPSPLTADTVLARIGLRRTA